MTVQDVIDRVRRLLADTGEDRWSDAVLLDYVDDCQRDIARLRPDVFLGDDGTYTGPNTVAAVGTTLTLGDAYARPLAELVAAEALREDADDRENQGLAAAFQESAWSVLGVKVKGR